MDKIELQTLVTYFDEAEDASFSARGISELCRDFYDGEQLDTDTKNELKKRGQPEVVFNMVQPKVDFLLGIEQQGRTDPKAFPRTPAHDEGADAVTDGIRFVLDNNEFDDLASDVFENIGIEGTGGVAVEVKLKGQQIEIDINHLFWNRLFVDPHSMRKDATDGLYIGYVSWMDMSEAIARWPKAEGKLSEGMASVVAMGDTKDDKPTRWYSSTRRRVMCVDICFRHKGVWHSAIFAKGAWLEEPAPSVYVDDVGEPQCKFIITSAHVDRDGQRYGVVKNDLDKQKEVNARRSKALHLLNTRQTYGRKGAVDNLNAFKKEANRSDGHLEFQGAGQFGKDFGIIPNESLVGPQFDMYQDAKESLKMQGARAAQAGIVDKGISGRAVRSLQGGDMIELAPLFGTLSKWKKRVYRAVWDRIKQFKKEEWWIRVTDNEENLKFVGLNIPMTVGEQLIKQKTGASLQQIRQEFGQELQQIYLQQPELAEIVVENNLVEMDVDIIIDEVPDVVNLQSEQFELLVQMYQANPQTAQNPDGIAWEDVLLMSTLRNKKRILHKELTPEQQEQAAQQAQAQQEAQELQKQGFVIDMEAKKAKAGKDIVDAEAQSIENQVVIAGFDNLMQDKAADTFKKQADGLQSQQKAIQTSVETELLVTSPQPDKVAII